tara:strand:- start:191 stop:466 length:276 start_codon:yes stop_codon:yes gene_type:complete
MKEFKFKNQIEGTLFERDLQLPLNLNGKVVSRGRYNLLVSIRDVSLFSKGIKAHRFWKLKDVKAYFGVTGSTLKVLEQLNQYKELRIPEEI